MKVTIDIDLTPEEARRFMGLPDVAPLQATFMAELETRMRENMKLFDVGDMLKAWTSPGAGMDQLQKMMGMMAGGAMGGGARGKKD